jgi:hypothetical protein
MTTRGMLKHLRLSNMTMCGWGINETCAILINDNDSLAFTLYPSPQPEMLGRHKTLTYKT